MVQIEIRSDSVLIEGYVNVTERESQPVICKHGKVKERIEQRAFERALKRAENVQILLNHNHDKVLGSTQDGNLELREDNIGLYAKTNITDPEVIEKARKGLLRGWSFGMAVVEDQIEQRTNDIPLRKVGELDLFEVSLIDERKNPCYSSTSVEVRADGEITEEIRSIEFEEVQTKITSSKKNFDNSKFKNRYMRTKIGNKTLLK